MTVMHQELAAGRWQKMSLIEQMANIGSEVERAFHWKEKNNSDRMMKAFERALELLDLTLDCPNHRLRLKEIARVREVLVDIFLQCGQFTVSESSLRKYFLQFACAVRKEK